MIRFACLRQPTKAGGAAPRTPRDISGKMMGELSCRP